MVGSILFVVAMAVTQLGWTTSYSLLNNYISDLGNTQCGTFHSLYICSPWHVVFNVSIIVVGVLFVFGAIWIRHAFAPSRSRGAGLGLIAVSGIGAIGVGLFPENVNLLVHSFSALVAFASSNIGMILLGAHMRDDSRWAGFSAYTIGSGAVGIFTLILFTVGAWGPLGVGGMERLVVAPLLLFAVVAGIHVFQLPTFAPSGLPHPSAARTA